MGASADIREVTCVRMMDSAYLLPAVAAALLVRGPNENGAKMDRFTLIR